MRCHLVQHYAGFVLILIASMIPTAEGLRTVQGSKIDRIFEVIEELEDQQATIMISLRAVERRLQQQVQSMFQFLNSSLQQMQAQLDSVTTNLQAVDRCSSRCDTKNQTKPFGTGDWIVIMYRFGGSLDFNRNWTEYRNGFGDKEGGGEFWLGNEEIHRLTSRSVHTLRIEVQLKTSGEWYYAEYSSFSVDSENNKYTLRILGYSGNAGDSITSTSLSSDGFLDGMKFTTRDRDNDRNSSDNCGRTNEGGWWFKVCQYACLTCENRKYFRWYSLDRLESGGPLRAARMMIKSQ